jgi:hypothetical protein
MNTTSAAVLSLSVGERESVLALRRPHVPDERWTLPVGVTLLLSRTGGDPSPVAIENAIQAVEDQIERFAREVPAGARLEMKAGALAPLQRGGAIAGLAQGAIALAQIEQEYQLLAARSMGAPSARTSRFDDPSGDALVLILRECLHHLGLDAVHVLT